MYQLVYIMYVPEDQQVVVHVPQVAQYSLSEKLATGLPAGEWNDAHSDHWPEKEGSEGDDSEREKDKEIMRGRRKGGCNSNS